MTPGQTYASESLELKGGTHQAKANCTDIYIHGRATKTSLLNGHSELSLFVFVVLSQGKRRSIYTWLPVIKASGLSVSAALINSFTETIDRVTLYALQKGITQHP